MEQEEPDSIDYGLFEKTKNIHVVQTGLNGTIYHGILFLIFHAKPNKIMLFAVMVLF